MSFRLQSFAFADEGTVPTRYTASGADVSPPLAWADVPPETKSLALVVDDPDAPDPRAPRTRWVHWIVYNLDPSAGGLPEGVAGDQLPGAESEEGTNDWKQVGYRGPCPLLGRHRYVFTLYALDVVLPELDAPGKMRLETEMKGHVIDVATLMGTYENS